MKPKFTEEERKLIGRRIRDSRNAEKYTLEQLAKITAVPLSILAMWKEVL